MHWAAYKGYAEIINLSLSHIDSTKENTIDKIIFAYKVGVPIKADDYAKAIDKNQTHNELRDIDPNVISVGETAHNLNDL